VLLGVLAQVNAACVRLVGEAADSVPARGNLIISGTDELTKQLEVDQHHASPEAPSMKSLGGVVSRESVAKAEEIREPSGSHASKSKKPAKREDMLSPARLISASGEETTGNPRPTKKKKKVKKGDEFDNLFKSLF
jgi:hypothetical protein